VAKDFEAFLDEFPRYVQSLVNRTEATRRQRFLTLLKEYYDIEAEELEKTLKTEGIAARVVGRIDALAGNVILEFKEELTQGKIEDAAAQLLKYARSLRESGDTRHYTLIVTDGEAFHPFVWDWAGKELVPSSGKASLGKAGARFAYVWIDDWIVSQIKAPQVPTAVAVSTRLGTNSSSFVHGETILKAVWMSNEQRYIAAYEEWERSLLYVYGSNLATASIALYDIRKCLSALSIPLASMNFSRSICCFMCPLHARRATGPAIDNILGSSRTCDAIG